MVLAAMLQGPHQDRRVLDRHRRALAHMRLHRVAGIADQHQPPVAPDRQRLPVEQRPLGRAAGDVDQGVNLGVEVGEGGAQLVVIGIDVGEAVIPLRLRHAGDEVDLVVVPVEIVDHHMGVPVGIVGPPLADIGGGEVAELLRGDDAAMPDIARVDRQLGPEQRLAHHRVDPVGADHDIGLGPAAVLEFERDPGAPLLQADQPPAELDGSGGDVAGQDLVEVAAVDDHVAGAERGLAGIAHVVAEHGLAGVELAADPVFRPEPDLEKLLFDAGGAQHLHRVGAEIDSGAKPLERGRLLVDPHAKAALFQEGRGDQPAEPRADDRYLPIRAHRIPLRC